MWSDDNWFEDTRSDYIAEFAGRAAAERVTPRSGNNKARGSFVSVGGIGLHYIEHGEGRPVVYIHGAGTMMAHELEMSDFGRQLAANYRIIAFDRPGYGHSGREPFMAGPVAQAGYLREALHRLNIERPILVGHSYGGALAVSYAVLYPEEISGIVCVAGWTHPAHGAALKIFGAMMVPMAGMMAHGSVPPALLKRMGEMGLARSFAPNPIPEGFNSSHGELDPEARQFAANSEDLRALNPDLVRLQPSYRSISMPVEIVLGMADRVVEPHRHGECLAREVPGSRLTRLDGIGHMVQHVRPQPVIDAVDRIAAARPSVL